ncbi:uncharacterized protein LOC114731977 [Neltuma alba]|uniref:uncharacterized protein LOC114731977 n=1 Tax=Neltuma alba TaxID=207710 RepID=UPI0010A596C8|nr:uncharacterized protein LOC114731977 [Prosopis alba]
MEKLRHKRCNVPSSADRSSQPHPALSEGNKEVHRRRKHPNLPSDSSSSASGVAPKDSSSFKFGWRSSKQLFGTPIKKLLAEEMSGETDSKRRAPSVIARLMGLDGMPLQQPANKQHKSSSEVHLLRRPQLEVTHSGRSSRRSSRDQQEFKDVFEVSEIPRAESCRYPSQGTDLIATDAEISFIEQKFMDAKRLATDRDSLSSKEFDDALEVLDSNTDLLLKYFQRPDSLFKKHLNDLQTAPLQSHCKYVEAMRSTDMEKYEQHHDFSWRSARDTTRLNCNRSHQKRLDGYPAQFDRRHAVHSSPRSPKLQLSGKDKEDAIPTRIVVLKPNLGKVQSATKFIASSCSSHAFLSESGNSAAYPDVRNRGLELNNRNLPDTLGFSRQNSMESREIAKEITRRMKSSIHNGSTIFSSSRIRGYAGDDSSCDFSENESAEESEVTSATMANSVDVSNHSRPSSRSSESSVSREAKKRLSERWKMTHKSQQVQAINRGSTLADMLAVPDKEMNAANLKSTSSGGGFYNKFAANGSPAGSAEPLGISSKDGWKDGCIGSLSRSRSLPASSTGFGSPRTLHVDRFIMPKEALKRERRKAAKSFYQQQGLNTRNLKSGHKKSMSSHCTSMEIYDSSPDIKTIQDKVNAKAEEDSPKIEVPSSDSLTEIPRDTSLITEDVVNAALQNAAGSSESPDPDLRELPSGISNSGKPSAVEEDNLMQQEPSVGSSSGSLVSSQPLVPGLESSCCKDADQPSPVSVLEPSFTDDLSSCSECFESLSADLQGLRMQLQMLKLEKLESEEYMEGPMLISSDEDGGEAYLGSSEGNGLNGDSWESSYINDVLSESGIDGTYPLAYSEGWHSLECPVSPTVFGELEKRYSDCTACSRPERRMLFDRVNSSIVKIYKQFESDRPWLNPTVTNTVGCKLMKKGLQDDLCALLRSQGKVENDALGKVLVRESEWLDVRDDVDTIGSEVERLILDDLVAEVAGSSDILYPK